MAIPFERTYLQDPPRERIVTIEKSGVIERDSVELIYKPPVLKEEIDESTPLGQKYKKALELCKETQTIRLKDAKSQSKSPAKKPAKNHPRANKPAMEKVQNKL